MTAPDPGLTDLIAAHTLRVVELNEAVRYPECNGCDWVGGLVKDHAAHVALVVEQHTNRRMERIATVLDAGANILDMHAAMLDNLVMDTPEDQARSVGVATQARRAAKAFRAALEGTGNADA